MAWRNEPAPLSLRLLTVMVAASAAGSKRASPCNNTKSLPAHEDSQDVEQTFSTLNGRILSLVLMSPLSILFTWPGYGPTRRKKMLSVSVSCGWVQAAKKSLPTDASPS